MNTELAKLRTPNDQTYVAGLFDKAKKKLVKKDCQIAGGVSDLESGGSSSASLRHIVSNKDLTAWASAWEAQELGNAADVLVERFILSLIFKQNLTFIIKCLVC
jgi:hypothetical protein